MDPQTVAVMDKIIVTFLGALIIVFIYWFFLGKTEEVVYGNKIVVKGGYQPSIIKVKAHQATTLTFLRKDNNSCLEEIVMPDFGIKEYLPLNTPVTITINPPNNGEFDFHCGMNMYHGKVVAV